MKHVYVISIPAFRHESRYFSGYTRSGNVRLSGVPFPAEEWEKAVAVDRLQEEYPNAEVKVKKVKVI